MLWMYQRVFFGEITHAENEGLKDLSGREIAVLAPIIALIFFMGIFPKPFLERMEPAVDRFVERVVEKRVAHESEERLNEFLAESEADPEDGEVR